MTDYTYNTGNPIGSTDVRDGVDNLKSFDVLLNSTDDTYQDRLGNTVPTAAGAIKRIGMAVRTWSSTTGGTLTDPAQTFLNNTTGSVGIGNYYAWTGAFPKVVAPGSDPAAVAGYVPRTDIALRDELASSGGAAKVGTSDGRTVEQRLAALPSEVDAAGTAAMLVAAHNADAAAHPQLSSFITAEADRAEQAADAASLSGDVYPDTASGLASTTNGQYFSVPSGNSLEYLILYLNNAGAAQEIKRYPSAERVSSINQTTVSGVAIALEDSAGFVAAGVTEDGTFFAEKASFGALSVDNPTANKLTMDDLVLDTNSNPAEFTVEDAYGFSVFAVREDGTAAARNFQCESINDVPFSQIIAGGGGGGTSFVSAENFDAEIVMIISYGQSNSVGTDGQPALTTSQAYDNLSFAGGVRPGDLAVGSPLGSFIPLVERDKPNTTNLGETPIGGATIAIKDLINLENGIAYTQQTYALLGVANGFGGIPIARLEKGTASYTNLLSHVTAAKAVAQSLNKTFKVGAVFWTQGESDTDGVAYLTKFKQLQIDLDTDIKAITKQQTAVPLISFAVDAQSSLAVKLAQIQASEENPNIHIACPGYPLKTGIHFNNVGFKRLGAYYGMAYKRIVVDKVDWNPLLPVDFLVQDDLLQIKFRVAKKPLVIDTTPIGVNYPSSGFSLTDSAGNAIAITGITIVNGDMVKIQAATAIPSGAKITYQAGNLRDSQGSTLIFGGGLNFPLHNWCVVFQKTL